MRVSCSVEEVELDGDHADSVPGIGLACSRCHHEVEVFGTSGRSLRRGFVMLREECPEGENNYYVADDADDYPD